MHIKGAACVATRIVQRRGAWRLGIMDQVFTRTVCRDALLVKPQQLGSNLDELLLRMLQQRCEGQCTRHGYVLPGSVQLVQVLPGRLQAVSLNGDVRFDVRYAATVCTPVRGMVIPGRVVNTNRFGVLVHCGVDGPDGTFLPVLDVIITKPRPDAPGDAPVVDGPDLEAVHVGETVRIRVHAARFELGDKRIACVGSVVGAAASMPGQQSGAAGFDVAGAPAIAPSPYPPVVRSALYADDDVRSLAGAEATAPDGSADQDDATLGDPALYNGDDGAHDGDYQSDHPDDDSEDGSDGNLDEDGHEGDDDDDAAENEYGESGTRGATPGTSAPRGKGRGSKADDGTDDEGDDDDDDDADEDSDDADAAYSAADEEEDRDRELSGESGNEDAQYIQKDKKGRQKHDSGKRAGKRSGAEGAGEEQRPDQHVDRTDEVEEALGQLVDGPVAGDVARGDEGQRKGDENREKRSHESHDDGLQQLRPDIQMLPFGIV